MAKSFTIHCLSDVNCKGECKGAGEFGIYALDTGFVQLVSHHDNVRRIVEFTPDEWSHIAVAGIKLGVIAKASTQIPPNPTHLANLMAAVTKKD
jgi:hypothetical protein